MASDTPYKPMTPPLTRVERVADALVLGVLVFWFAFLGMVPQKGRAVRKASDPSDFDGWANNLDGLDQTTETENEREVEAA